MGTATLVGVLIFTHLIAVIIGYFAGWGLAKSNSQAEELKRLRGEK